MHIFTPDGKKDWTGIEIFLAIANVVALAVLATLYIYYWQVWYHSDYALVGLIGKHVLDTGDCPIYIWKIGYQGMLVTGHLVALLFGLFGVSARALDVEPLLFLLPLFFLYFKHLEASIGRLKSLLATLFIILGSRYFYGHFLRAVPNYTETSFFGLVLICLYFKLIRSLYINQSPIGWRHYFCSVAFGLVAGFALYTYGQILYYFGIITIHFGLIYLRSLRCTTFRDLFANLLFPRFLQAPRYVFVMARMLCAASILVLIGSIACLVFGNVPTETPFAPLHAAILAVCIIILVNGINWLIIMRSSVRCLLPLFGLAMNAFLLGVSPKLYYNYNFISDEVSQNRLGISGSLPDVVRRLKLAIDGLLLYHNLERMSIITVVLGTAITVGIMIFVYRVAGQIREFTTGTISRGELLRISPLVALPLVVIPAFTMSPLVVNLGSARYEMILIFFTSMALGSVAVDLCQRPHLLLQMSAIVLSILLLTNNSLTFYAQFTNVEREFIFADIVSWLKDREVKYGYADYWYAYSVTFLTQEEIILEPTSNNYIPYYGDMVRQAKRLAYIDPEPVREEGGYLFLNGKQGKNPFLDVGRFRVLDKALIRNVNVYLIERQDL